MNTRWFRGVPGLVLMLVMAGGIGCGSVSSSNNDGGGGGSGGGGGGGPGGGGSGGGGPGGGGGVAPTVASACAQMAETLCGRLETCAPFHAQVIYGNPTTCRQRVVLGCMKDQEVPDITRTANDIVTCSTAASSARCQDLLADIFPESCRIKPGLRLNGEGCGSSLQCMSMHCEKGTTDCGVCAPRAAANGACTVTGGCVQGLVCANRRCVMPGALNAACDANRPCIGGLYCSTAGNVCAMPRGLAASCAGDTGACDLGQGVACNVLAASPTCQTVAVAEGGEACGIVNATLTLCVVLNQCSTVCPNPAADGQQCNDAVHCMAPANCVGGLCRLPSVASCPR